MEKTDKDLYADYLSDLGLSHFNMKQAIVNIETWLKENEMLRNGKLRAEFEKEKEKKKGDKEEIDNQLEEIKSNNKQKILIDFFKDRIAKQNNLLDKYTQISNEINRKIKEINDIIPQIEKRIKDKSDKIKFLNKENIKLMERISQLEKSPSNLSTINYITNSNNISGSYDHPTQTVDELQQISLGQNHQLGVDLNEIVEQNEFLREQYYKILELKREVVLKRREKEHLSHAITEMNNECFAYKKIYTEGMNLIANELLKVHEIRLDKVVSSSNNNGNSLYFEIVKGNLNGNKNKNDDSLKLPLIRRNIMKKYNYPIVEKANPSTVEYGVIKNLKEENYNNNKIMKLKKNKFPWNEFRKFSPYQIYTILNLDKEMMKKIETYIFPRKKSLPEEKPSLLNSDFGNEKVQDE